MKVINLIYRFIFSTTLEEHSSTLNARFEDLPSPVCVESNFYFRDFLFDIFRRKYTGLRAKSRSPKMIADFGENTSRLRSMTKRLPSMTNRLPSMTNRLQSMTKQTHSITSTGLRAKSRSRYPNTAFSLHLSSLVFIPLLFSTVIYSQKVTCEDYYIKGYYPEAIHCLEDNLKGCEKKANCEQLELHLGKAYYEMYQYEKAAVHFSKVNVVNITDNETQLQYIQCVREAGEYKKVSKLIDAFKLDEAYKIQWVENPSKLKKNDYYTVANVAIDFGKTYLGAAPFKKGILTSSPKKNKDYQTIGYQLSYFEKSNDSTYTLSESTSLPPALSEASIFEGNPTSFGINKIIFCKNQSDAKWYKEKTIEKYNLSDKGESILHLFELNTATNTYKELAVPINKKGINSVSPYYDKEHQILFFSQNENGNQYDIYYSKLLNGTWIEPKKVPFINTEFDDVFPVIHKDKIYYSSRGGDNLGGLDLFEADIKFSDKKLEVTNITNLSTPVNSSADDFAMLWNEDNSGYFASNRPKKNEDNGTKGNDRLYYFTYNPSEILEGKVVDDYGVPVAARVIVSKKDKNGKWVVIDTLQLKEDGAFSYEVENDEKYKFDISADDLVNRTVYFPSEDAGDLKDDSKDFFKEIMLDGIACKGLLSDIITNKTISNASIKIYDITDGGRVLVDKIFSDKDGNWEYKFNRNRNYKIEIETRDYEREIFDLSGNARKRRSCFAKLTNLELSPKAKEGDIIKIDNIYFDFNSSDIRADSYEIVDNIVLFLNKNPNIKVELSAHTDCVGKDSYNMKLSKNRAKSCYDYILSKGISSQRIIPVGYGETQMVNPDCKRQRKDKEYAQQNRRIEVKILSE